MEGNVFVDGPLFFSQNARGGGDDELESRAVDRHYCMMRMVEAAKFSWGTQEAKLSGKSQAAKRRSHLKRRLPSNTVFIDSLLHSRVSGGTRVQSKSVQ